ncbi:uncharacterized protein BJ171DRAFT_581350 [Polychytrium aggregatum]|uniref:uncharacterized protein n=1 Tax=Polychytrium aggregatum TaxID=110093 RepID=UPI0022FEE5AC|nr:uncharacterized protein BJ171DRAFT_581350 [Polychytrium aggregatum]KAI9205142.1 hypothetical protein BJ171DRAFT_581350 [Polychytrium aggregatum]
MPPPTPSEPVENNSMQVDAMQLDAPSSTQQDLAGAGPTPATMSSLALHPEQSSQRPVPPPPPPLLSQPASHKTAQSQSIPLPPPSQSTSRSSSSKPSKPSRAAAALCSRQFAVCVTALVYYSLGILPEHLTKEEIMNDPNFAHSIAVIHGVLSSLSNSIPLTIVFISITLLQKRVRSEPIYFLMPGQESHMFITALMLSQKLLDDRSFKPGTWKRITQLDSAYLNALERDFCRVLSYQLSISPEEYQAWLSETRPITRAWER